MDFPHLSDSEYPDIANIDVYRHKVVFDYSRWIAGTRYKLCNVNFCADYDDVVKFDTDELRDGYFDSIAGFEDVLVSEMRMQDDSIRVPLPFDVCKLYNYIVAEYPVATPDGQMVDYEISNGKRKFFFFIMDTKYLSPNCTELVLQLDMWTTYINDVDINYMMLERGHAPMHETPIDKYLENPIGSNAFLCAPDVDYGTGSRNVSQHSEYILNQGEMCAIFACTGAWGAEWGSGSTIVTPCDPEYDDGFSASQYQLVAVMDDKYRYFVGYMSDTFPHWIQTIKGIFILPRILFDFTETQGVTGCKVYRPTAKDNVSLGQFKISNIDLGLPADYRSISKLYTFPYSWLEITDGLTVKTVRIEDCKGRIDIDVLMNAVFPYMNAYALLRGIGGNSSNVSFKQIGERDFRYGGLWYDYRIPLDIPCYAMLQSGADRVDYAGKYERIQAQNNATLITTQAGLNTDTNDEIRSLQNQYNRNMYFNSALQHNASMTISQVQSRIALYNSQENQFLNLGSSAATGAANGAALGFIAGAPGSVAGALAGGLIGFTGNSLGLSAMVTNNVTALESSVAQNKSYLSDMYGGTFSTVITQLDNYTGQVQAYDANPSLSGKVGQGVALGTSFNTDTTDARNDLISDIASGNRSNAEAAISNNVKQRSVDAPLEFGANSGGQRVSTEPCGIFVNVCRENDYAIMAAGDEFARFGYALNRYWRVDSLTPMRYFSYWKASDLWVTGAKGIIEGAQEAIKAIFKKGVTIWKDDSEIGTVPIHANH